MICVSNRLFSLLRFCLQLDGRKRSERKLVIDHHHRPQNGLLDLALSNLKSMERESRARMQVRGRRQSRPEEGRRGWTWEMNKIWSPEACRC